MADVDLNTDACDNTLQRFFGGAGMPRFIDRSGVRYGRLIAQERVGTNAAKQPLWRCVCDCGALAVVSANGLSTGNTRSCGCLLKETITKHGGAGKRSYNTWRAMLRRCKNPDDKDYPRYGGKGVSVCEEWLDYNTFAEDMGEPPDGHTLDRVDPYGNYGPGNCRWATLTTQARNIRQRLDRPIGVQLRSGKWYAEITVKRKKYYGKGRVLIEDAVKDRADLEKIYWAGGNA